MGVRLSSSEGSTEFPVTIDGVRMSAEDAKRRMVELSTGMTQEQRRRTLSDLEKQIHVINAVLEPYWRWKESKPVLEKNDCSRLHRLVESANRRMIVNKDGQSDQVDPQWLHGNFQTFVVKHNWAAAFESAEGVDDSWRMPYDLCAFEFRISGRNCIVASAQNEETMKATLFVEFGEYWMNPDAAIPHYVLMFKHVRAMCIALDAEVATTEVVRAPVKLNEKRAKTGKTPLPDYRVVDLARRHRIANPAASAPGTGTKKRLHFRRGHWRHFDNSKTWVKWCLVGNPDLGFINKHYRL